MSSLLFACPGRTDQGLARFPDNVTLQADSLAVNAAAPQAPYNREPGYNGGRADLGAYGNTLDATQRPPLSQMGVTLDTTTPLRIGRPGETISYTLTLRNSGVVTDSYLVDVKGSNATFRTSLYEEGFDAPRSILGLAPQEQISLTVWVRLALTPISSISNTVSVRAFNSYGVEDEVVLTTTLVSSFQEIGGQTVMEAEHFTGQVEGSSRAWLTQTVLAGYVGPGYMSALPDTDFNSLPPTPSALN